MADNDTNGAPSRRSRRDLGLVVTGCLAGIAVMAPLATGATGNAIREGIRNPFRGDATRETQIIAKTAQNVYGTRQSNTGAGGAAIYGCRSTANFAELADPARSTPCLRVNNLSTGLVYSYRFATGGVGGVYQAGLTTANDPKARPFITNATAVATGLNADRLDGLNAQDIIDSARGPQGPAGAPGATGAPGPPGISGTSVDETRIRNLANEQIRAQIQNDTQTKNLITALVNARLTALRGNCGPAGEHSHTLPNMGGSTDTEPNHTHSGCIGTP